MALAEKLGKAMVQLSPEQTSDLEFEYAGDCTKYADVLTDGILKGIVGEYVDDSINLINARVYADERGFEIKEVTSNKTKTFADLITIKIPKNKTYKSISATLFGDGDYRIVDIDGYRLELRLEGDILLYQNEDKPGMLAAVSGALAKDSINIGSLSLGRAAKGSSAITAVSVDRQLSEAELKNIEAMDGIQELRFISLGE